MLVLCLLLRYLLRKLSRVLRYLRKVLQEKVGQTWCQCRCALQIRSRYDHDTVMIRLRYK
jgi:hypothetical protein